MTSPIKTKKGEKESSELVILDSLRHIVRSLRASSSESKKRQKMSGAQLFVLQQLADGKGLSINELAQRTFTHQSSVSVVVSKLVEKGLVTREASPHDARITLIKLKASGKTKLRLSPKTAQENLISALGRMSAAQKRTLSKLLKTWVLHAGLSGAPAPLFFESAAENRGKNK
jgi:DNA-binding MarR family transcriptional regulator